jgi:hypothetical protein
VTIPFTAPTLALGKGNLGGRSSFSELELELGWVVAGAAWGRVGFPGGGPPAKAIADRLVNTSPIASIKTIKRDTVAFMIRCPLIFTKFMIS